MALTIVGRTTGFNPRTPGGVRPGSDGNKKVTGWFQSTHPGRGATFRIDEIPATDAVSIHAPRAGCDILKCLTVMDVAVSIHAPRAGCDATASKVRNFAAVSIHAPRAGCDFVYGSIYHRQ